MIGGWSNGISTPLYLRRSSTRCRGNIVRKIHSAAPPTPLTEEPSQRKLTYSYDELGRVTERKLFPTTDATTPTLRTYYGYNGGGHGAGSTTGLVSTLYVGDRVMNYQYDEVGNILFENNFHYGVLS